LSFPPGLEHSALPGGFLSGFVTEKADESPQILDTDEDCKAAGQARLAALAFDENEFAGLLSSGNRLR
jgi:hypothetical protein